MAELAVAPDSKSGAFGCVGSSPTSGTKIMTPKPLLYVWPFPFFKNADRGTNFEKSAAIQHNIRVAHYLPIYMAEWTALSALLLFLSWLVEVRTSMFLILMSASFGVLFSIAVCVLTVMTTAYLILTRKG